MTDTSTLEAQLAGAQATILLMQEALADVEASFAREDAGWAAVGGREDQFTAEFRSTYAEAMRGVKTDSSVDELRRRRDAARAAAG